MSGYLESVREQLIERTEQRGHGDRPRPSRQPRPPHRRRRVGELLAIAGVLLVAAAVAAAVLTVGSAPRHRSPAAHRTAPHRRVTSHRRQAPSGHARRSRSGALPPQIGPAPSAPAGPVPAGFSPESFTAIGEYTWWLLGSAPCSSPPCTSIVRTDDGGHSFVGIPAPRTSQVDQLRFANPEDGFAYGPQLWVTRNAGADWAPVRLGAPVADLEASDGYVYAIIDSHSGGTLIRSPVGVDHWRALTRAGAVFPGEGLWAQGSTVLALGESSPGMASGVLASTNFGATFVTEPLPSAIACGLQEPQPPVLWEHCSTGMMSGIWRSPGGGAGDQLASAASSGLPTQPNSAAFAAASATTAVTGFNRLYRTADAGAHWSPVVGAPGLDWSYLGFTDPTHGVAIGNPSGSSRALLYYTTDGGESYHLVTIR
jgi:photosystem II stability/assembly factor-like uncharacterized protein